MLTLLFWGFIALDVLGVGLFYVLGLAAAGPSKTSPLAVTFYMLLLPAIPLAGAIWLFLRSVTPAGRVLAIVLAAAPMIVVVVTKAYTTAQVNANSNAQGDLTFFREGPQRDLVEAIRRNDSSAVALALPYADVNAKGMEDMTPLVLALRALRTTPDSQGVLKALLAAGANPNLGTAYEFPLEMALQIDDKTGPAPVELLLAAGASPNTKNSSGAPIFFAGAGFGSPVSTLERLIAHGADVNAFGPKEETILIYAATAGNWPAVRYLMEHGADWKRGRSSVGKTFQDIVESAEQMRSARGALAENTNADDDLSAVLKVIRAK